MRTKLRTAAWASGGGILPAWAHEGHGLPGVAHWHASDVLAFAVAVLAVAAFWWSRRR